MNKVHLIGNAHLDPVWLWQWQEGFAEIKATFRSALDRMKEFDDFIFTSACGAYYMWIEQSDPQMFEEIRARVKEGRWCLSGGWLIQPDCNMPSGESFARHALITQNYFLEKFGKTATTGYNVDSFGHNASIPKILHASRMKNYVFMRPMDNEKTLPANLFVWESPDGSRVPAYRIPLFYNISLNFWAGDPLPLFEKIKEMSDKSDMMAFYGVGNHGGGPTYDLLRLMHEKLGAEYVYSDPDKYFEAQKTSAMPTVKDDLQFHAKGCYSACAEIKKNNRYSENALIAAEKLSVLSNKLIDTPYPARELEHAWKRVLFNQFHDILGGCSIREAYDDARMSHGEAMAIAQRTQNFACQQISWNIDTLGNHTEGYVSSEDAERMGVPIVIFNSLDHEIIAPIHIRNRYNSVKDQNGNDVAIQVVRDSKTDGDWNKHARLFEAKVPALGYVVYRMFDSESTVTPAPFVISENSIQNSKIRIVFDSVGELCSVFDIEKDRELLSAPTSIALYDDSKNDTWAHGTVFFKDKIDTAIRGEAKVIERGPVRATVRSTQRFADSTIIRDYSITPNSSHVDVKVKIDFREKHKILKFRFPLDLTNARAFCKIPYGSFERATDGAEQVCGDWIALCGDGGGITVATDSKHSFDAEGNVLSFVALRSAMFADHYGQRDEFCEYMDQGEHRFSYRIAPFESLSSAERNAEELQFPPIAIQETFHKGSLPASFSGIGISADNISITAVKEHREMRGTVVRVYENSGIDTDATLTLFGKSFDISLAHDAVKTFLIADGNIEEIDFLE
jgi:alpha-mannosidase